MQPTPAFMKRHSFATATQVLTLLIVLSGTAWAASPAAVKRKPAPPGAAIENLSTREILDRLREARARGDTRTFDALGLALAGSAESARPVLRMLQEDPSVQGATLAAELLVWLARGNDIRDGKTSEDMPTEELGQAAGLLLGHPDPFVFGLAEFALSIRLGEELEGKETRIGPRRFAKPWPAADAPDWYRRWAGMDGALLLDLDYVRQAAALGWHRDSQALVKSGELLVSRSLKTLHYIRNGGEKPNRLTGEAAMEQVRESMRQLTAQVRQKPENLTEHRLAWLQLRRAVRAVALANPDLDFTEILLATRQAAPANGNITVGRWNVHPPGGDICIKRGLGIEAPAEPVLRGRLGPGHVRGMELSWDADRVVFGYARQPGRAPEAASRPVALRAKSDIGGYFGEGVGETEEPSHLFEVRLDGTGLRQLTDARYHVDQEPTYLPNGDIVFVSDRSNFGSQCAGALQQDNMILNLYRCDPDGKNIRPLSNNKDFDRHPHIMDNGQVLFLHWEYQERHLWNTHTLWTCRPDGTMTDALYKQHIETGPMSLREARQVRGQSKLMAIACGHHNFDQGAVFLADYTLGINAREGMRNITPGVSATEGGYGGIQPVPEGGVQDRGGHYMFPYPLSDKSLLASYSYKLPEKSLGRNFALYYVDVWGNKELIHRDKKLSVAFAAPLRQVPRPPMLTELPVAAKTTRERYALATVADVHAGWSGVQPGTIKYLRISQKVPWPCVPDESKACGFNDLHWMPAAWEPVLGMWDWGNARVIGIVPVEPDGSAYFKVPAEQPVYFQALDENFLEVRRMRSNVTFPAGESRGCIGCHESKAITPPPRGVGPMALSRPPSTPQPPPWGDRTVPDFERDIQPILDRHCVGCHGEENPKASLEFTARKVDGYLQSYRTIFGLRASDPTPFAKGYWSTWHPDQPPLSEAAHAAGREFLKNALRAPPTNQLVRIADYTGGAEVTEPEQFGSRTSKLTLTLVRDPEHRKAVRLSRDDWLTLVTWVDLNAQYWGTFVEKDGHFVSKREGRNVVPPRRVRVVFPDPWERPPAGEWFWENDHTVALKP